MTETISPPAKTPHEVADARFRGWCIRQRGDGRSDVEADRTTGDAAWNRQFEADAPASNLDARAEKALRAHNSNQSTKPSFHQVPHEFWSRYHALPGPIREQADKAVALLKANPQRPSLHFKMVVATGPLVRVSVTGGGERASGRHCLFELECMRDMASGSGYPFRSA